MPGKGSIDSDEKWVVTIEIAGARTIAESNRAEAAITKLVARLKKPRRNAKWTGKTIPK